MLPKFWYVTDIGGNDVDRNVIGSVVVMKESVVVMLKPMMVSPMPTVVMMMMLASDVGGVYDSHSVNNDVCGAGNGDVIDDAYKSCCVFWCL
ncbi:hypothetical protein DPMN_156250 [Dreissena polymorpha]|uniref:Uncharacterized protein n=1 Tax=Dreissena polymorpha TaxID=45954 RepID=A0A9D4FQD5_DREPO|nr:hypothetical protein DPMN_156250 [Dreissena polymorpha]